MNHLLNITRKELKELLTPGSLISIVFVVILFMALGQGMSGETEKASAPSVIGVIYESDSPDTDTAYGDITYRNLVQGAYIALYGTDVDLDNIHDMESPYGDSKAICKELSDRGYKYAVAVPKTISTNIEDEKPTPIPVYYVFKDGGVFSTVSAASATSLIISMSDIIANKAIQDKAGVDPVMAAVVAQPLATGGNADHTLINGEVYDGITPSEIYNAQMSQSMMIPIVVMIVITMVGSVIITSMGSEKENKTLETLLTMPVRRTTIVSGKLLAAALMGLIYGIFYLIGMLFYTNGMTSGLTSSVNLDDYGLSMTAGSWAILFAILFLAIFTALGMCMILGAFTKNYKMAQTMVMPITVLAIIPMM
ncbi:MAG: ABC transporter permease, partial [Thermoplasmata archaeon]|nr:ABC transporter permease [Thermoplasmata archaeon]